jgi:non-specific serine/threonine protein kinase
LSQAKLAAGILQDPSIIGKMCKGQRLSGPQARERVLAIIRWLRAQGALEAVAEANALLDAAGMAGLHEGDLAELAFMQQLCESAFPDVPEPHSQARPTNLPAPLTSFVGRRRELAEMRALLATTRLLTLTGPGGTGKTRLAMQLASALLPTFAGGVWLVDLAPLADSTLVLPTIAATFALREVPGITLLDLVANSLRTKRLLLILDNCEHLVETCAQLADCLLRACPMMQILASSREALGIGGETVYQVPSLAVPDSARLALDTLRQSEAVHLFIERATAAQPRFILTDHNATAVVQICRQLDGIPLAIELAAARLRVLTVEQIATRLDDRFRLLTGGSRTAVPRQQTLRALFDWSYALLSEAERTLFRQLSIFAGGWTLEALEAINYGREVLELLAQLVNKSLVAVDGQDGEARYHLLETIRQYARDKLVEIGEAAKVCDRHLEYYLQLAEAGEPHLYSSHLMRQLDQFAVEHDNFRAALQWGAKHNADAGLRLAGALAEFWARRGYHSEGRTWLQALLDQVSVLPEEQGEAAKRRRAAQAKATLALSTMVFVAGDIATALTYREASVRLYRQLEDRQGLGRALGLLGYVAMLRGQMTEAERALLEAITLGREAGDKLALSFALTIQSRFLLAAYGDLAAAHISSTESARLARENGMPWAMAQAVVSLAGTAAYAGDWDEARAHIREALALFHQLGDRYRSNTSYSELAHIERRAGNLAEARRLYKETIVVWQEFGQRPAIAHQLECFAFLAGAQNQSRRAARLLGAAEALRETIGASMTSPERIEYDREVTALQAQMEAETAADHWARGRKMTLEEAVAYALE